jgi:hypothetical protein
MPFGHGEIFQQVAPFQSLVEEKSESSHVLLYCAGIELLVLKQVRLVLPQMVGSKFVGRLLEVLGKVLHDSQVAFYGILGVITTLEFLQHHFSKLGHRDLLVTHKYRAAQPIASPLSVLAAWRLGVRIFF